MMIKYRVTDVAKDFGVPSKEIVELLAKHFQPAKKSATALEENELDVIFEHYTQKHNSKAFDDPNTLIYGHNMGNGSMFADVHKFKKGSFFEENEYLYVYLPGHVLTYRIYALFDYSSRHLLWAYDFTSDEGYQKFIDKTLNPRTYNRLVREGVTPTTADRVVTLSTCQNTGDGRLLLVAVLVEDTLTK